MPTEMNSDGLQEDDVTAFLADEDLSRGVWPKSVPLWMAAGYVSIFIIRPWEQLFPVLADIRFELLYALAMISVVAFTSKKQVRFTIQSSAVVLFSVTLWISALAAQNRELANEQMTEYRNLVIFYFVLLFVLRSMYGLLFMVAWYIVTMMMYLGKSQWEFFVNGQHRYDMGVIRMVGIESTYGGPNSVAMSVVVSLPFLVFLWTNRTQLSATWPKFHRKWFPTFLVAYFALAASSIVLTNSRSGMLGFIVFVAISTLGSKGFGRKLGYIVFGVVLLTIVWQLAPEENKGRFRTLWQKDANRSATVSADGRKEGLLAGLEMFRRYPVAGVGVGNFVEYRVRYLDGLPLEAHNLLGQLLGETGIIGGGAFTLMLLVTFANILRIGILARGQPDTPMQVLARLAAALRNSLFLMVFLGIFGHNLFRFNWLWLAVFADQALLCAQRRTAELLDMQASQDAIQAQHNEV